MNTFKLLEMKTFIDEIPIIQVDYWYLKIQYLPHKGLNDYLDATYHVGPMGVMEGCHGYCC